MKLLVDIGLVQGGILGAHVSNILAKLGAGTRTEAVATALKNGLVA